jgi:hypothetical protein
MRFRVTLPGRMFKTFCTFDFVLVHAPSTHQTPSQHVQAFRTIFFRIPLDVSNHFFFVRLNSMSIQQATAAVCQPRVVAFLKRPAASSKF